MSNLRALDEAGVYFIVGARQTRAPHDLETHWRDHGDYMTDGQIIDHTIANPNASGKDMDDAQEGKWGPWRALWHYSAKRAARDNKTLTAQQRRALDAIDGTKPTRRPRFVAQSKKGLSFDQAAFDRAGRLVGLKGYITNLPTHMSPGEQIISHYHELWHVEQSFRMSKTDLKARPIFHHTRDAIQAHLTIVITALAISRHLHTTTGITAPKIVKTLIDLQEVDIILPNGHKQTAHPHITPQAQEILNTLGH